MTPKSAFDVIKDYKVEEIALPYEKKDGEISFLLNIEHLKNGERKLILDEKNEELGIILAKKYNDSYREGRNKGLYKSTMEWLEDPDGYQKWLEEKRPHLIELEQCFWIIDKCWPGEECGYCGSYLIVKKDMEEKFFNNEQTGLMLFALDYNLKETERTTEEENKYANAFAFNKSQPLRNIFESTRFQEKMWKEWYAHRFIGEIITNEYMDEKKIEELKLMANGALEKRLIAV